MHITCNFQDGPIWWWLLFAEKVKDLFPDATLSSSIKLVLVNVVYFKGRWDREFKKEHTKEEEFWLDKVWSSIPGTCLYTECKF